jgi:hypothetical protein
MNSAPRVIDDSMVRLHKLASPEVVASASRASIYDLNQLILHKVERPPLGSNNIVDPITITPFLNHCRELVEEQLIKNVAGYSKFRWLWYLRRLPRSYFEGELSTTYPYDAALAEVVSGLGGGVGDSPNLRKGFLFYPINESVVKRILKFRVGVSYLSQVHTLIRMAGKGAEFRFTKYALPEPRVEATKVEAIRLYDNRVENGGAIFGRVGTVVTSEELDADLLNSVLVVYLTEPDWGPATLRKVVDGDVRSVNVEVYINYVPKIVSLKQLTDLNTNPRLTGRQWWTPEIGALLLLLKLGPAFFYNRENSLVNALQYGYFPMTEEIFLELVNKQIGAFSESVRVVFPDITLPTNAENLLSVLESLPGSPWPLIPGPPIRRAGNYLCIDLYAATWQLNNLLEFPRIDGEHANVRAEHFELAVQDIIDSSTWSPPDELRNLRGKGLRKDGQLITDLDAIGAMGDTLLIVSCKSLIYSADYDAGDYALVRNAATTVEKAVNYWNTIKSILETNPKGDNFDFQKYRNIVSAVCTPRPVYTPIGPATEWVAPGLRAASALTELGAWLQNPIEE